MRQLLALVGVATITALFATGPSAQEPRAALDVFPAGSSPYGASVGEWFVRWNRWVLEAPKRRNPLLQVRNCTAAPQPGERMWFLSASSGGRHTVSCTIGQGRPIFLPLAGSFCPRTKEGETIAVLRRECALPVFRELKVLRASFDGRPLPRLRSHRFVARPFTVELPASNILDAPAGRVSAIGAGYAAIIRPPAPGRYTVVAYAEFVTPGEPVFKAGMTYRITVE